MIHSYEDLIDILEKEFSLCTQLAELLQKERDVIVSFNSAEIELLLNDKKAITGKIRAYDETRERILESLGFRDKTVSEVAEIADKDYRERLTAIASEFISMLQSISELNEFNSRLIEKSLYFIRTSYSFLKAHDVGTQQKVSVEA